MMIFTNLCLKKFKVTKETGETFAKVLSPFAPHLAEELWKILGHKQTLAYEPFPIADKKYLTADTVVMAVSFNGKRRFEIEVPIELDNKEIEEIVLKHESSQKWLEGKTPKKTIVVPAKIVNVVV
jgi:leucyl-tRNA synthetase